MNSPCSQCGSTTDVEIHHVRQLRSMSKTVKADFLIQQIVKMNRKQIPMCKLCHIKYHQNLINK